MSNRPKPLLTQLSKRLRAEWRLVSRMRSFISSSCVCIACSSWEGECCMTRHAWHLTELLAQSDSCSKLLLHSTIESVSMTECINVVSSDMMRNHLIRYQRSCCTFPLGKASCGDVYWCKCKQCVAMLKYSEYKLVYVALNDIGIRGSYFPLHKFRL